MTEGVYRFKSAFHALSLDELKCAVGSFLDVSHILVGITGGLVKGDIAGHAVVVYAVQSIADGGAVGAACCLDGFQSHHVAVVAQCRNSCHDVIAAVVG